MTAMKLRLLRMIIPLAILAFAVVAAVAMVKLKPEVPTRPPEVKPPLVRVVDVQEQDRQLTEVEDLPFVELRQRPGHRLGHRGRLGVYQRPGSQVAR